MLRPDNNPQGNDNVCQWYNSFIHKKKFNEKNILGYDEKNI